MGMFVAIFVQKGFQVQQQVFQTELGNLLESARNPDLVAPSPGSFGHVLGSRNWRRDPLVVPWRILSNDAPDLDVQVSGRPNSFWLPLSAKMWWLPERHGAIFISNLSNMTTTWQKSFSKFGHFCETDVRFVVCNNCWKCLYSYDWRIFVFFFSP